MTRRFEVVSAYKAKEPVLPTRQTELAAGYDIAPCEDVEIAPGQVALVPTGLKAVMGEGEFLAITIRSSWAIKRKVTLANCPAIIDADYANNPENEGHIILALWNFGSSPVTIKKGERVAQGIFMNYLLVDGDRPGGVRKGGLGST